MSLIKISKCSQQNVALCNRTVRCFGFYIKCPPKVFEDLVSNWEHCLRRCETFRSRCPQDTKERPLLDFPLLLYWPKFKKLPWPQPRATPSSAGLEGLFPLNPLLPLICPLLLFDCSDESSNCSYHGELTPELQDKGNIWKITDVIHQLSYWRNSIWYTRDEEKTSQDSIPIHDLKKKKKWWSSTWKGPIARTASP